MSLTNDFTRTERPAKPYPEFPLYSHKSGRWAKKIRGRTHYFGPWRDPHGALRRYLSEKDDLEAGRQPQRVGPGVSDALTVEQMVFRFLDAKKLKVLSGEMVEGTWKLYEMFGDRMIRVFGANTPVESLGPPDFQRYRTDLQKTHKTLESIKGALCKTKAIFNWAGPGINGQGYIERIPRFGDAFRPPSRSALDRQREEQGPRVFTAEQIRAMVDAARPSLKAMIFLGINCGFGNTDCAKLVIGKLDLAGGWATFARTKNAIKRRNPLWPETVEALRAALKSRKPPRDTSYATRVFITKYGQPFRGCAIGFEFEKLAATLGLSRGEADFYDLRRTCASIGVQVKDDNAVRTILGHKRPSTDMLGVYNRLGVGDERLKAVTDHIRRWLFTGVGEQSVEADCGVLSAAPSEPVA
jgi:integrase